MENVFIQGNALETVFCKMSAILPQPQYDNSILHIEY